MELIRETTLVYRTTPQMAERKAAHRRKLLAVAVHRFGREGYHATTVPDIVADSGSSTGSFYFYFRNKEDIFAAVLESVGEHISAVLNEAIAPVSDPLLQMRTAVERLFLFFAENPDEARILIIESSGLSLRLHRIRRNIISSHCRSVERALQRLSDVLPPMNPGVVARCWVGAVYESVYHWLETSSHSRLSPERMAQEVAQFNLRGIGGTKEVS